MAELRDPAKLSSWIFRIAYNLCQDHFRKKGESFNESSDHEESEIAEESSAEKQFEQPRWRNASSQEVDRLPESLRTVIILSDMMELNQREIADVLGITVENAKVRLHRARKRLKEFLEQKCTFDTDERNVLVCEPKENSNS